MKRAMKDGGRRCVRSLMVGLVLSLIPAIDASADEWENLRANYEKALRAQAKRIADIEARERGAQADASKRAEKLTRDRISGLRGALKGEGEARHLADAAERASGGAGGLAELSRAHTVHVEIAGREWGRDGSDRRGLRDSIARVQQDLERANESLADAVKVATATTNSIPESGASERVARIEAKLKEAGDRIRARLLNQQAALERERVARERAAAERERSLR